MGSPGPPEPSRVIFVQGVLAAFASLGQEVHYDHVRRLCGLTQQEVGSYLSAARAARGGSEPDLSAIVVRKSGTPGPGWGDSRKWRDAVRSVHQYWSDRRSMDNGPFFEKYDALPSVPGARGKSRRGSTKRSAT
jgi:hypothetical protein